jgi:hypothetical protein
MTGALPMPRMGNGQHHVGVFPPVELHPLTTPSRASSAKRGAVVTSPEMAAAVEAAQQTLEGGSLRILRRILRHDHDFQADGPGWT